MFWNVLLLEKDKIFKRSLFWIELALLTLLIVIIDLARFFIFRSFPQQLAAYMLKGSTWPDGLINAVQYADAHAVGGFLLIILIGTTTAQEYSWRTMHMWLCYGIPRPALMGAKFVIMLLPILLILLTSLIVSGGITGCISLILDGSLHTNQLDIKELLLTFLETAYVLLPYVALTYMIAVTSRSVVITISVSLAFVFLVESNVYIALTLIGGNLGRAAQYLPIGLAKALSSQNGGLNPSLTPPTIVAIVGIAIYTLLFGGITLWAFQRQSLAN